MLVAHQDGDVNYNGADAAQSFTITKAVVPVSFIPWSLIATYDGTAHYPAAWAVFRDVAVDFACSQGGLAVTSPTNAGNYDVTATMECERSGRHWEFILVNRAPKWRPPLGLTAVSCSRRWGGTPPVQRRNHF